MAKLRLFCALILLAVAAHAQRAMTVDEVVTFVKSQIKLKGPDRTTADYLLHKIKLTQRLEDRTIEELQGLGAGAQTVKALRTLSENSAGLAAVAAPVVVPAPRKPVPPPDSVEQEAMLAAIKEYARTYTEN